MGRPKTVERVKFNCQYCNIEVEERKTKFNKRKRFNCSSKSCVKLVKSHPGNTNGMYGKTHTEEIFYDDYIKFEIISEK